MKQYLLNNLIAIDQLANTILNGAPDETLSARAYRTEVKGKPFGRVFRPLIDLIFFFEVQHCYRAYLAELDKRQLDSDYQ